MTHQPATLELRLPGPIDVPASLSPLGRWGDDGLDRWDGHRLVRTLRPTGSIRAVAFVARPVGTLVQPGLDVELETGPVLDRAAVADAIAAAIAPDPTALSALAAVGGEDSAVGALIGRYPGVRPVLFPDPFTALVRSISAQQVNLRWAAEIRRRLALGFGRSHAVGSETVHSLDPEPLAGASVERLRALQLTGAKAAAVVACARAAVEGRLERGELAALDDEDVIDRLTELRGIGRWSAEWFLARTLGRPRVVAGDLGVRKAVGRMYATAGVPLEPEVRRLTAHWGAAASLVQALALHDLAERGAAPATPPPAP